MSTTPPESPPHMTARRDWHAAVSEEVVTRTSRVWLDLEGLIEEVDSPGSEQDLEDALENVAANARVAQGMRRPLLVDMSQVRSITRIGALDRYSGGIQ